MNYGRRKSVRLSKAFASVSIEGKPADSVVPLMGSTSVAPNANSPKVSIRIDEVPK
jgi:hypothetical protein